MIAGVLLLLLTVGVLVLVVLVEARRRGRSQRLDAALRREWMDADGQ